MSQVMEEGMGHVRRKEKFSLRKGLSQTGDAEEMILQIQMGNIKCPSPKTRFLQVMGGGLRNKI